MVDIVEVSAIVAAAGVLVGVVFTVMELRNLVKQRQTDLVMRLWQESCSEENVRASSRLSSAEHHRYFQVSGTSVTLSPYKLRVFSYDDNYLNANSLKTKPLQTSLFLSMSSRLHKYEKARAMQSSWTSKKKPATTQ